MRNFSLYKLLMAAAMLVAVGAGLRQLPLASAGLPATPAPTGKTERLLQAMGFGIYPFEKTAAQFRLTDVNGREFDLAQLRGKIVFLNFWASWCPDCRAEMPSMQKLHERFKDKNFEMVTINLKEPAEHIKKFFKTYKLTFMALLDPDGKTTSRMAIRALPTTLIIDKNGTIMAMALGSRQWDGKKSVALFKHLTAQ